MRTWATAEMTFDLIFVALIVLGHYWWWRAMNHPSEIGRGRFWTVFFWSKLTAGRENFTEIGWAYWIKTRLTILGLVILIVAEGFLKCGGALHSAP